MSNFITIGLLSLGIAGCHEPDYVSPDDPHRASIKVPSIDNTYEMVAVGKPPLTFLVKSGGWLKVLDETDNTMLNTTQVPADTMNLGLLVKLDPDVGALTFTGGQDGSKPVIVQPIQKDHRFEIYYQR